MLAILSAPGSRGDVNPMVAIGRQLRLRGYDVVISLAEPYADVARRAGLCVEPIISRQRFDSLLGDRDVWSPVGGVRRILSRVAAEFLPEHDAVIRKHHRAGQTVLVSHPLDFASRIFREVDEQTPLVNVHLAPAMLRVPSAPAKLTPWWFEISRPTWAVKLTYWVADRFVLDPAISSSLRRLRSSHGLPRVGRYLDQWWLSPDLILALYPQWFAPETEAFSPRLQHVGFPLDDGDADPHADELSFAREQRPIVFTSGTAHRHGRAFFQRAVRACVDLDRPGLLLSTHPENFPQPLPPLVRSSTYLPLGRVLPSASAIVHHGGVGTTSQALASATPQLIRPHAFDQFDNATRVERLGCGTWLRRDQSLLRSLEEILRSDRIAGCCRDVAMHFSSDQECAAAAAARHIERLVRSRSERR